MTTFRSGADIRKRIVKLITDSSEIDCAVAFWGRGATDLFPSTREKSIRIVCDLMSGACNPAVIRDLMRVGVEIKKLDGMHAKIYWTQTGAIIGSANASANGLGEEDEETSSQAEAAIYTDEPEVLREASAWFNEQWKIGVPVDEPLLRQAEQLWKDRRANRPVRSKNSLLDLLRNNPDWFKDRAIWLVVYDNEDMSPKAQAVWERDKGKLYDSASLRRYDEEGWWPLYEDATGWDVAPSEYVIDYNGENRKPSFGGIWRIRQEKAFVRSLKKHRLILLDEITAPFGLRFPRTEQNELGGQIKRVLAQENREPDKNGHYLDLALHMAGKLLWPS
jgi:hypothetical protein